MYKGVVEDFKLLAALRKPSRTPVVACSEEFDVHNCGGGITYNQYNRDAKLMAQTQIAALKKFNYDWAWLQVDDCIIMELLGVGVKGDGDILPATFEYLPAEQKTLENHPKIDVRKDGRCAVLLEAIKLLKAEYGDEVLVCGRIEAPFSSVGLFYGIEEMMMLPLTDPDLLNRTIEYFTNIQLEFAKAQKEAGADAVWVGDCNASGHLISEDYYQRFSVPSMKILTKKCKEIDLLTIYHASEEKPGHLKLMAETGIDILSVGPGLEIEKAVEAVGDRICLIGNLDPINVLMNGTPELVASETERIMKAGKNAKAYVFNTGEMNPRDVPEINMITMLETARKFRC